VGQLPHCHNDNQYGRLSERQLGFLFKLGLAWLELLWQIKRIDVSGDGKLFWISEGENNQ